MEGLIVFLFIAGVITVTVIAASNATRKKDSALEAIAAGMGGTVTSTNSISARRNDIDVTYKFADRGVGSSHEPWTEVSAQLPPRYPLTIRIVRGRPRPNQLVVDIELGSPEFDDFFIVEAAPADVVKHLIDEPARRFLIQQHGSIELATVAGGLRISQPGWIEDPSHARGLADYVALLASRVRDAYAAANAKVASRDLGSPYRPQQSAVAEDVQAEREREIAQVHHVQAARAEWERRQGLVFLGVMIGSIVLLAILLSSF